MAKDQDHLWVAMSLLRAYPQRYEADTGEALAEDAATLLSYLPDDDDQPERVRPTWGAQPAGFRP